MISLGNSRRILKFEDRNETVNYIQEVQNVQPEPIDLIL